MELLSKIAAVFVTLLLYFVITILQTPRTARAADGWETAARPDQAINNVLHDFTPRAGAL